MSEATEFLESDDLIELAGFLFGDPPPIRDAGLLAAAAARPQASAFGGAAQSQVGASVRCGPDATANQDRAAVGKKKSPKDAAPSRVRAERTTAAVVATPRLLNITGTVATNTGIARIATAPIPSCSSVDSRPVVQISGLLATAPHDAVE